MGAGPHRLQKEVSASPGNAVPGICEPLDAGTRNQSQLYFKSSERLPADSPKPSLHPSNLYKDF